MKRREFLKAGAASMAVVATAPPAIAQTSGTTFLVCTGAWSAGWSWKKMHPLMAAAGHRLVAPTYTGLGEREHLASPSNDLETHIQPRSYIYLTRVTPADPFRPFAERAKNDRNWRYYELDASHSAHVTAPEALARLLQTIASQPT